ncbi:hypothetical protein CTA2_10060 [Colletotrichum tanaceti]|uniref:Core trichothecene cluster (CTC) protein 14 n=1 Tax=Colletotrichum tanaceti TaxID=1306861 RepID=A0A4V6DH32_9PEZI|nr:hypothetical protein CTA2_10060 [Colletotrichum tanaceti]TKW48546.1 hypothetical protein CTA1_2521 [Colletotrichum tanaceti]
MTAVVVAVEYLAWIYATHYLGPPYYIGDQNSVCPDFQNNFSINYFQLYPGNAEFDRGNCLLYVPSLYNSTLGVFDPNKNELVNIVEFPGISHNPDVRLTGIDIHSRTGLISILATSTAAFETQPAGSDLSGDNIAMLYDPVKKAVVFRSNLTVTSQGGYGGFTDLEQDPFGNIYVSGKYPGSIMRLDKFDTDSPRVQQWYISEGRKTTTPGFGGLAAHNWILLTHDNSDGQILKFNLGDDRGKPVVVPVLPKNVFRDSTTSYLPPKYRGTVLLVSGGRGVRVFQSEDAKWNKAEYVGTVYKSQFDVPKHDMAVATVQVGDGINMVVLPKFDKVVPGTLAGDRSEFPFYDITQYVDGLLAQPNATDAVSGEKVKVDVTVGTSAGPVKEGGHHDKGEK